MIDKPVGAQHCCALNQHLDCNTEQFGKPIPGSISTVIRSYKGVVSKRINIIWQTKGQSIWQRNFYEHIGREQKSVDNIQQYILNNPQRWGDDPENRNVILMIKISCLISLFDLKLCVMS
ncbi:MAG: transposase [Nostoc sp.]|uniref:transposase n=1 Tax=Nostoc sp. TaxID=1180 RepID=UPI002FFCAC8E